MWKIYNNSTIPGLFKKQKMYVPMLLTQLNGCNPRIYLVTKDGKSTEDHLRLHVVIPAYDLLLDILWTWGQKSK